jgi:hypothetical protein
MVGGLRVNSHILSYLTYPKKWLAPPPFKNPGYATAFLLFCAVVPTKIKLDAYLISISKSFPVCFLCCYQKSDYNLENE